MQVSNSMRMCNDHLKFLGELSRTPASKTQHMLASHNNIVFYSKAAGREQHINREINKILVLLKSNNLFFLF